MADQSIPHQANIPNLLADEAPASTPDSNDLGQAYIRITQEHQLVTTELRRMEDALRASERQYKQLIERASDVVYVINKNGFFLYANPATQNLIGHDKDTLIGRHFTELLLPEWEKQIRAFYARQVLEQIPETTLEFPVQTSTGETKWVEQVVTLIFHEEEVVALQSIVRDITKRKKSEESLRDTTIRLNTLLENLQVGILMENGRRELVFANHEFCRIFGLADQSDTLLGSDCSHLIEAAKALFADPEGFATRTQEILKERQIVTAEELLTTDGRTLERDYTPLIVDGVCRGNLWQYRDITERKYMENSIIQSELHLRSLKKRVEAILNNSSDAIIVAYADGGIQQANPAFGELLGYQPDEIFKDHLSTLVHPDSVDRFTEKLNQVIATRVPKRIEITFCRKNGENFPAEAALSLILSHRDGHDEIQGIICSLRDITKRKRMEEDLRQALAKERELSELKTRFVSMASHEFRTPLATIQTTADALQHYSDRMDAEQRNKRFAKINTQVRRMTTMLDDVLTLGRMQNKRLEFLPQQTAVHPLFIEIVEDLNAIHHATHTIVYSCTNHDMTAYADPKLLRQIITNLMTNAIKYSPAGSSVYFAASEKSGKMFVYIRDEGIGIPEDDQKHLFQAFHRARNVGNTPGTGLGLAITEEAIKLHNGTITFRSSVGQGTIFTICLPTTPEDKG